MTGLQATVLCRGYLRETALEDVRLGDLMDRMASGDIRRPEFEVHLRRDDALIGLLVAGPLFAAEPAAPSGRWCVTFADPNDEAGRWCLAAGPSSSDYRWFVFCGAETELLESCAV